MIKMKKTSRYNILGVITARGGSKGIPRKNIKKLGNKPLIAYTIEAALKSRMITHLVVSTDDEEIARVARRYGANVPFLRPKNLAQDNTPTLPVIQHALKFMENKLQIVFHYTAILQPTSPFRLTEDIDKPIELLISAGADSAVSLVEVESGSHPIKMKRLDGVKVLPLAAVEEEGMRRQDFPVVYKRSSAIYAQKRSVLMANKIYGKHVVGHVVPKERSIDIDDQFDWLKAQFMLKNLKKKGYLF